MPNAVKGLVPAVLLVVVLVPAPASAWGFETHKYIMSRAIDVLPAAIRPFFQANRTFIVEHCVDPDLWRVAGFVDEPPRHFVDIDAYGAYPFTELPRDYNAALKKFGREMLVKNGLLPWRTDEMAGQLGKMFQQIPQNVGFAAGDVKFFSAIIGHYVADAHVPFHAVMNYDGQLTGQTGIHVRFEEDLFVRYRDKLNIQPPPLRSTPSARDLVFDTLLESYTFADKVLAADRAAIGDRGFYDDRYYDAFFAKVKPILEKRIGDAISAVASLIASEWEQAGRPALPVNPPPRPPAPRRRSVPTP
jgi:hypothetical protein